jgi:AhpD family alkylhydroperoxidase
MNDLTVHDRALVGLGAALGSNCIPCVEHHIRAARDAGLDDDRIRAALDLADTIRQVPARRALARATELLGLPASGPATAPGCCAPEQKPVEQTLDAMAATMQRMMAHCGGAAPATLSGCQPGTGAKPSSGCC